MAAGCTLRPEAFDTFSKALGEVAAECLDAATLERRLRTDGPLPAECWRVEVAQLLNAQVWGQGFEAPLFCETVQVLQQRVVGERHLKLRVRPTHEPSAAVRDAIFFNRQEPLPDSARLAYKLELNEWQGRVQVQMVVMACG